MRSLRARVTLVTVAVAVIAVVITGLLSLQFVRSSTRDQARAQLSAQADILATLPRLASAAELADKASLALGGTEVALVTDGTVSGTAAEYVDALILTRLAAGATVSTTRQGDGGLVMVEARPARDGTAVVLALPLSTVERAVVPVTGRILLALALGLLVAVVGGTLLARLLSRPLTDTAAAARRLASGERGVPMPRTPTAEIADLAVALSSLDAALAASEGRQREFLLSISHELRTPLTAVRGYGEALADGLIEPSEMGRIGQTLVAETERLDGFVADLLELARLEADDFSVTPAPVDLGAVLREAAAAWAGRASTIDVTVLASGTASAVTDARRVRQLIDGLIENALRVSPAGSTIALSVEVFWAGAGAGAGAGADADAGAGAIVRVHDGGPGLSDEDLEVAFERGLLRARYRDIRPVGTGLGLSIAARLVERLGGTISAANAPAAGGAIFTVTLPTQRVMAAATADTAGTSASRGS